VVRLPLVALERMGVVIGLSIAARAPTVGVAIAMDPVIVGVATAMDPVSVGVVTVMDPVVVVVAPRTVPPSLSGVGVAAGTSPRLPASGIVPVRMQPSKSA
jgi:hypothetical protein